MYLTHGLGVPLIAVRPDPKKGATGEPVAAQYYPASLSFPVTAFMRPLSKIDPTTGQTVAHNQCVLELHDPLSNDETLVAGQRVPLESDLTTPLAYFLSKSDMSDMATLGLLRPEDLLDPNTYLKKLRPGGQGSTTGLYMVQPYEPGKIPVLMVHGLWSTPMTWLEMFNDLRSQPEIRDRYQFWFYLYPTAQPFWLSAAQLRSDLAKVRQSLDPQTRGAGLGSDGADRPQHGRAGLAAANGPKRRRVLEPCQPRAAAPDQGRSRDAAEARRDVLLPAQSVDPPRGHHRHAVPRQHVLHADHAMVAGKAHPLAHRRSSTANKSCSATTRAHFPDRSLLRVETSIDSLAPSSPIFPVMLAERRPPWVLYHNIIGVVPKQWWLSKLAGDGDGVVSRQSAHVDDAVSEITVPAIHTTVHQHPAAVLEVRRILLEHIADLEGRPAGSLARRAARVAGGVASAVANATSVGRHSCRRVGKRA